MTQNIDMTITTTMRPQSAFVSSDMSTDKRDLAPPVRSFDKSRRQSSFNSLLSSVPEDSDAISISASSQRSSYKVRPAEQVESGEWTLDLGEVDARRAEWKLRERVILVLGEYSPAALETLLANPIFANTLIILGSLRAKQPLPSPTSGARLYHLPPPKWAHSTIQEVVERAIPIAASFRKKHNTRRGLSFFSRSKCKVDANVIDCVINILSPALRFDPRQAMPKLLREVVMSTTAVLASVPREKGIKAMPLVQMLPASFPAALPSVVERYLVSLQQTAGSMRPIALGQPTFVQAKLTSASDITPIEAILYEALSWSATYESADSAKRRCVYLPGWSAVTIASNSARSSPDMLSHSASYHSTLSTRRGSAASTASRSSMFSTIEDGSLPITPSGSSDSLSDRVAPSSPVPSQQAWSVSEQKLTLHIPNNDPYATLKSLPQQRSRLSYVQTADESGADSPTDTIGKRASWATVVPKAAEERGGGRQAMSELGERDASSARARGQEDAKVGSPGAETIKKKGSLGWMRRR